MKAPDLIHIPPRNEHACVEDPHYVYSTQEGDVVCLPNLSRAVGKSGNKAMSGGLNRSMQPGNVRHASG